MPDGGVDRSEDLGEWFGGDDAEPLYCDWFDWHWSSPSCYSMRLKRDAMQPEDSRRPLGSEFALR
jgi:hypothetical protein